MVRPSYEIRRLRRGDFVASDKSRTDQAECPSHCPGDATLVLACLCLASRDYQSTQPQELVCCGPQPTQATRAKDAGYRCKAKPSRREGSSALHRIYDCRN